MPDGSEPAESSVRPLSGRTAVVTGGGSGEDGVGIGAAIAILLARNGAHSVIVDRDSLAADWTAEAIEGVGGSASVAIADVRDEADCSAAVDTALERTGAIDVLVNSVGVVGPKKPVTDVGTDNIDEVMGVNVRSAILMCKHAVPHMHRGSSIVNISSVRATKGGPATLYCASKGAINALTISLASQHGADGIRVNAIAPGEVWTPLVFRGLSEGAPRDELRARRRASNWLLEEGTAWDIAEAALFLASGRARWITGQILTVDGGHS